MLDHLEGMRLTAPAWLERFARNGDPASSSAGLSPPPPPSVPETVSTIGTTLSEAERDRTLALLRNLARKGFLLELDPDAADQIVVDSDREVPPELLERLTERKPAILALLKAQAHAADILKARPDLATETRSCVIDTIWGRVWIVPKRTGAARVEATWAEIHEDPWGAVERCHQLAAAIDLFDGKLIVERE